VHSQARRLLEGINHRDGEGHEPSPPVRPIGLAGSPASGSRAYGDAQEAARRMILGREPRVVTPAMNARPPGIASATALAAH
jgi:hypothetical protein